MEIRNFDKDSDLVDIRKLYVIEKNGVTYFVRPGITKTNRNVYFNFFDDPLVYYRFSTIDNSHIEIIPIRETFKEIHAYPNGLVPRKLLEFLYYEANNIDSRTLQMCYDIKE